MICRDHLLVVYRGYAERTRTRVAFIDQAISCPAEIGSLSDDERRNEPTTYAALFSDECRSFLEDLYEEAMRMMRGRPLVDCEDTVKGLAFLQEVAATALWRHQYPVGDTLASFAREFDRLDVPSERERLHARAQSL